MAKPSDDDEINVIQSGSVTMSANSGLSLPLVSIGTALSLSHLYSAAYFARQSFAVETGQKTYGRPDAQSQQNEHRAYVMGAVFMAIAFLDALINEEYDNHKDHLATSPHWGKLAGVIRKVKTTLPQGGDEVMKRLMPLSALDRFRAFLILMGVSSPLGPGDVVYDRADTLCAFRNRLVHYEPIWQNFPGGQFRQHRHDIEDLRTKLQAEFEAKPAGKALYHTQYPYGGTWVYEVLCHACAEWAVTTAKDFVDAFYQAAGIPRLYDWSDLYSETR